jgi:hypothetical protein
MSLRILIHRLVRRPLREIAGQRGGQGGLAQPALLLAIRIRNMAFSKKLRGKGLAVRILCRMTACIRQIQPGNDDPASR